MSMSLLAGTVQPPLLTLLSSTSSPAQSPLFISVTEPTSDESFITPLRDTDHDADRESESESSAGPSKSKRFLIPHHIPKGCVAHRVVHIQSPNPRSTYIQAGCSKSAWEKRRASSFSRSKLDQGEDQARLRPLGVELPWLGMQVKRLGRRELSFEVGFADSRGREGVVRCSSFKKNPTLHPHRSPPLVHLPLNLPPPSSTQLTPWLHIPLNLTNCIPLFHTLPRPLKDAEEIAEQEHAGRKRRKVADLPGGAFGSVTYVRVYANCRVRRIWFSAEGERTLEDMGKSVRDEWELYAAEEGSESL